MAHGLHVASEVAAGVDDQNPALQFWQLAMDGLISSGAYVPAGQLWHTIAEVAASTAEKYPLPQGVQVAEEMA